MAVNKEVLEGWAQAINRHRIEAGFHSKPTDTRDTGSSTKLHVDMEFVI
jgi:hypothetical protein